MPPCSKVHTEAGSAALFTQAVPFEPRPLVALRFLQLFTPRWINVKDARPLTQQQFITLGSQSLQSDMVQRRWFAVIIRRQCQSSPKANWPAACAACFLKHPSLFRYRVMPQLMHHRECPDGAFPSTLHINHSIPSAKAQDKPLREHRTASLTNAPVVVQGKCRTGSRAQWIQAVHKDSEVQSPQCSHLPVTAGTSHLRQVQVLPMHN